MANDTKDLIGGLLDKISEEYWSKMFKFVKDNSIDPKEITGFLINPEKIVFHISSTHIAMEYYGREKVESLKENFKTEIQAFDYSKNDEKDFNFFEKVIGFNFSSTGNIIRFPLTGVHEELIIPTNKGADKLIELKWNFAAQNSILGLNTAGYFVPEGQFARLVNCIFFDANENGLITRRVKWIDFIPVTYNEDISDEYDSFQIDISNYIYNWLTDLAYKYPLPKEFKYEKLVRANRFIEMYADQTKKETDLTSFLEKEEYKFIISMAFFAKEVFGQIKCEWQSESKPPIKPDFFVLKSNGYADIVEFKLPQIKGSAIVGGINREKISAEIESYIAQTRVYKKYFNDPNNRRWFEEKYGFKVHNPKRFLVIGRRWDFNYEVWAEIKSEYPDLEILTYDDLIDGVVSQFYM